MRRLFFLFAVGLALFETGAAALAADPWLVFSGATGPGLGKHVVLVSGDEEYRSEEALPQLGRILATRHGFKCTVLFAVDPKNGNVDPNIADNIPGLDALDKADLMIIATRFRNLSDNQMEHIVKFVESGKPVIGMRTATHAFKIADSQTYGQYSYNNKEWEGGFGRQVLGETWLSHHGQHGKQSTRGIIVKGMESHPILRGIKAGDIWGPTDVYGVRLPLPGDSQPLLLGQILVGMHPNDQPLEGEKNNPMMPVAWTKSFTGASGKKARVFTTTMGSSTDLVSAGVRRMLVNATFWAVGIDDKITDKLNVDIVGVYEPHPFKFNGAVKGQKPAYFAR